MIDFVSRTGATASGQAGRIASQSARRRDAWFRRGAALLLFFLLTRIALRDLGRFAGWQSVHHGSIEAVVESPRQRSVAELELVPGVGRKVAEALAQLFASKQDSELGDPRIVEEVIGVGPKLRTAIAEGLRWSQRVESAVQERH